MADRAVFQSLEAESARQDVRRDLRQRVADSNLDGADCAAGPEVLAAEGPLRLVALESRRAAPHEPVGVPRSVDVARRAVYRAAAARRTCPRRADLRLIRTASSEVSHA